MAARPCRNWLTCSPYMTMRISNFCTGNYFKSMDEESLRKHLEVVQHGFRENFQGGNRLARRVMIQVAWLWIRHQPESELTKWFRRRTEGQSKRMRCVMIVALARKLAIALWRYLETGLIPEGAANENNCQQQRKKRFQRAPGRVGRSDVWLDVG